MINPSQVERADIKDKVQLIMSSMDLKEMGVVESLLESITGEVSQVRRKDGDCGQSQL